MIKKTHLSSLFQALSGIILIGYQILEIPSSLYTWRLLIIVLTLMLMVTQVILVVRVKQESKIILIMTLFQVVGGLEVAIQSDCLRFGLQVQMYLYILYSYSESDLKKRLGFVLVTSIYTSLRLLQNNIVQNILISLLQLLEVLLLIKMMSDQDSLNSIIKIITPIKQAQTDFQQVPKSNRETNQPMLVIEEKQIEIVNDLKELCQLTLESLQTGAALIKFTKETFQPYLHFENQTMLEMFEVESREELFQKFCQLQPVNQNKMASIPRSSIQSRSQNSPGVGMMDILQSFQMKSQSNISKHKRLEQQSQQSPVNQFPSLEKQQSIQMLSNKSDDHLGNGKMFKDYLQQFQSYLENNKPQIVQKLSVFSFPYEENIQNQISIHDIRSIYNQNIQQIEVIILGVYFRGEPIIIVQARDVTHRVHINHLVKQNDQKQNTLSFVSHEYRTPLDCIIRNLEQSQLQSQKQDEYVKASLENSKYLLSLSNDLLDMAMIKAGKFFIKDELFDVKELIRSCIEMFELQAARKQICLRSQYESRVQTFIVSDPRRIRQILINLIGNAFKFTQTGSITVNVKMQKDDNVLQISVIDTGIGIREIDKPTLLQEFGKCGDKENQKLNPSGVGLGLVISNRIAAQISHNNSIGIQFESTYKQGSSFWFYVLNQNWFNEDAQEEQSFDLQPEFQEGIFEEKTPSFIMQKHSQMLRTNKFFTQTQQKLCICNEILIVDDNIFNIDILTLLLKRNGITNIDSTISGILAEEKIQQRLQSTCQLDSCKTYKLIFMDVCMPIQNGHVTTQNILRIYKIANLEGPIVIGCSGFEEKEEGYQAKQSGMTEYIMKPITAKALEFILQKHYK